MAHLDLPGDPLGSSLLILVVVGTPLCRFGLVPSFLRLVRTENKSEIGGTASVALLLSVALIPPAVEQGHSPFGDEDVLRNAYSFSVSLLRRACPSGVLARASVSRARHCAEWFIVPGVPGPW